MDLTLKCMETKKFQFSMARKRVKLAYIIDAAARKAAYRKIKKGLAKKLSELTTLCGTETCAVIYSPTCDYQPEVWPSAAGAQHLFSEFKALPDIERSSRMVNS
ncbi:agamous-like MADS-box protein AGL80 [Hibiscus syriacus]|uniref:agamous-like MADS-box protein AGL80 n=1 Tax=Hibiscus syriacus TaxID=106335 RepID=UPI00192325C3|nr:agamous-like MADS-box protein AGL80 [Hibiscus syriacus]